MRPDPLATLRDLISLPSVNPMGRAAQGPEFFEARVTDYLERLVQRLELPYERQTVAPQRDNLFVRIEPREPGKNRSLLVLEVHQDTVPVDGMTIDPWRPVERDGRIYGRGACDIKGGMAALLAAVARLAESSAADSPTVVLVCTVNEEYGHTGARAAVEWWNSGRSKIVPRPPDAIVVAEPTLLNAVVAHKGTVRWRLHTHGRAAHSSRPQLGENAIFRMADVLAQLEIYQRDVVGLLAEHPLVGRPTISVGTIQGGLSANTVPDRCSIEIDRRVTPGEDPAAARQHLIDFLAARLPPEVRVSHDAAELATTGLHDANNGPLAERLCQTARSVAGASEKLGVPYGTDASVFSGAGIPTVVFGPGSIEQAHTADEWLALDQLALASEVYYQFAANFAMEDGNSAVGAA
ncbi:MAG TPA: M20 family metallopeptidase [Pirellulales bacterium]|jgi:acetylornithine deacetylase|nr:M20 family metallopeptidase [Pirellulales bacterium]